MPRSLCAGGWVKLQKYGEVIWAPNDKDKDDDCDAEGPKRPPDVPDIYPGDPEDYEDTPGRSSYGGEGVYS